MDLWDFISFQILSLFQMDPWAIFGLLQNRLFSLFIKGVVEKMDLQRWTSRLPLPLACVFRFHVKSFRSYFRSRPRPLLHFKSTRRFQSFLYPTLFLFHLFLGRAPIHEFEPKLRESFILDSVLKSHILIFETREG